ncbi:hypothetical protein [Sphingomonas sp.]|uniref:hypothetical protein n=1 Tax=Sphingomonas sp. TaxID=28214 RepID=UPI003AFFC2E6
MEACAAQRAIGQDGFGFARRERPRSTFGKIAALVAWESIAALLGQLYPATEGERLGRR